ncbi:MAG: hypothetical protein Q7W05_12845 [Deltaproteobacteria bacterium]|nr:hypothetical protein [Deltaproteobacteria bacterium]
MDMVGGDIVTLRVGTVGYPMAFMFAAASSETANDGSIPFGSTITGVAVTVAAYGGGDISADVIGTAVVSGAGLQVDVTFKYSTTAKKGICVTLLKLTLSTGAVITKRWDGLKIE